MTQRQFVGDVLRGEGWHVALSPSAEDAFTRVNDEPWSVVFCDVMRPGRTGIELYQRVREIEPPIAERFVFLVGGLAPPGAMKFLDSVSNPRLVKPFSPAHLQTFVRSGGLLLTVMDTADLAVSTGFTPGLSVAQRQRMRIVGSVGIAPVLI